MYVLLFGFFACSMACFEFSSGKTLPASLLVPVESQSITTGGNQLPTPGLNVFVNRARTTIDVRADQACGYPAARIFFYDDAFIAAGNKLPPDDISTRPPSLFVPYSVYSVLHRILSSHQGYVRWVPPNGTTPGFAWFFTPQGVPASKG